MPVLLLGDAMDLEVTETVYCVTRCCWPQVVRARMGDIQELWGVIRMGFLEEEVCKLSQEMKIRRNKNQEIANKFMRRSLTSLVPWESH